MPFGKMGLDAWRSNAPYVRVILTEPCSEVRLPSVNVTEGF